MKLIGMYLLGVATFAGSIIIHNTIALQDCARQFHVSDCRQVVGLIPVESN